MSKQQLWLLVAELCTIFLLFPAALGHIKSAANDKQQLVRRQLVTNNPGFISIDCGAYEDYVDPETGIFYKSDREFISTGENREIAPAYYEENPYYRQQLRNLRFFPTGRKNCYRLQPEQGKNQNYLIRLHFKYGNYDTRNKNPVFSVYLGVNFLASTESLCPMDGRSLETYYYSSSETIYVCLVNTGSGIPFISALELRFLNNSYYQNESRTLLTLWRDDSGNSYGLDVIRYKDDIYDRMWAPRILSDCISVNTTTDLSMERSNYSLPLPAEVWRSAIEPRDSLQSFYIGKLECPEDGCYFCLHFKDISQSATQGKSREFNVTVNNQLNYGTIALEYLMPLSMCYFATPFQGLVGVSLNSTNQSQLPPILNAFEIFEVIPFPDSPTHPSDVEGILGVNESYNIYRDEWQGDPCVPKNLSWNRINCSYDTNPPRIIYLDLSSSRLTGNISSSFSILKGIKYLDLSNNELTGTVPEFLAQLPNLIVLNLSRNKLTGPIPPSLMEKFNNGILNLSLDRNPNICQSTDSCAKMPKSKRSFVVPLTTSVIGVLMLLLVSGVIIFWKKHIQDEKSKNEQGLSKNLSFSFPEIARITDNFKTIIGEGGFGKVYLGTLIDRNSQLVAVKLLSQNSRQGYKEFQAEAVLLMIVHHRNLVSLIGYCDDNHNKALIYEYMGNGNLREHLSETRGCVLSWAERLQIALDAAHGLEYLHNGCKPPIVHRDLKTSNILLDERLRAKISDFGLSRTFATESDTHISTTPAGTYGYMAPEAQACGNFNRKTDVYGFGIIILELITGQPAIRRNASGDLVRIQQWVISKLERGDIKSVIDPKLQGEFEESSAWKAAEIALACANDDPAERPDMSIVLVELKECLALTMPAAGSHGRMESRRTRSINSLEMRSLEIDSDMVPSPR